MQLMGQPRLENLINHVEMQSYEFPQTKTTNCSLLSLQREAMHLTGEPGREVLDGVMQFLRR